MGWELPSTIQGSAQGEASPGRLHLLVVTGDRATSHPVPSTGSLTVGRAETNGILVDDPEISREHATFYFGRSVQIEDLGSANGTRLRGRRLDAQKLEDVAPGDLIEIGSTIMLLQRSSPARPATRRLWSHSYFELRIEEECARGAADRTHSFAVVRVRIAAPKDPSSVQSCLIAALGPGDVVASYAPGEYELLLSGAGESRAEAVAGEIEERAFTLGLEHRLGLALYPRDGRIPDALIARASAALRGDDDSSGDELIATDPKIKNILQLIERVARGPISVLLLGETGVGKELFAHQIHARSPRSAAPFVTLNCAAFSDTLIESELFGHEKGAFTGADATKTGLLESADGGTVFLDELGEMPLAIQAKLLRVIEQRQVQRVGSLEPKAIDVRFVSATNRDLERDVEAGLFRQDLLYRLNAVTIEIPPLRERAAEIVALADRFLTSSCQAMGIAPMPTISARALDKLQDFSWPGNIRELRNVVERAVLICSGSEIDLEHLPLDKMSVAWGGDSRARVVPPPVVEGGDDDDDERARIIQALARCGGNQTRAAAELGISRRTLTKRLGQYNLPRPLKGRR